jgi:hypothetical protein
MIRVTALSALAFAAAALVLGSPAEAGGGIRLNFGGPLPSFVATPTPGYGGGYSAPRKAAPKAHAAKRKHKSPAVVAERRKPKTPPRVVPVRLTPASRAPKAVPSLPVTASETENPGFIGRTLAVDELPRAETVHTILPTDTIVALDAPESRTIEATPAPKAEIAPKVAAISPPATCRKFIPAVGVTVTVACD